MFKVHMQDIGIDLGTANTLIYSKEKGIILDEPSVIAVDIYTDRILATGQKAKEMGGRAPERVRVVRPLQNGVISDFVMTQAMLTEYVQRVVPKKRMFGRLRVVVGVPSGVTEVEKRAVEQVIRQLGAKDVYIIVEPLAAAIGAGMDIDAPKGCMIADIGGGTTDIAILSMGEIVNNTSIRSAGDKMDEAIVNSIKRNYNLLIGMTQAENIKITIGCISPLPGREKNVTMRAMGRDVMSGLPKTVDVQSCDIMSALEDSARIILDGIKTTLEQAPPELSADIVDNGLVLVGGGALVEGLDAFISRETGLNVVVADNAMTAVVQGAGKSLMDIQKLKQYVRTGRKY